MKKISTIITAGAFIASFSVSSGAAELSAGVKGGLGIADFKGSGVDVTGVVPYTNKALSGLTGGLAFNVKLSDIFGAEVDFLYCKKGSKSDGYNSEIYWNLYTGAWGIVDTKGEREYDLSYIDIPVLIKFIVPLEHKIKPAFFMGPSFNLLLSSEMNNAVSSTFYDSTHSVIDSVAVLDSSENRKSLSRSSDMGLVVGASAEMPMGPGDIVLDVRYSFGLSDLYKKDSFLASLQNTFFSVMVGYNYRF